MVRKHPDSLDSTQYLREGRMVGRTHLSWAHTLCYKFQTSVIPSLLVESVVVPVNGFVTYSTSMTTKTCFFISSNQP